jgi:hypothetical protein
MTSSKYAALGDFLRAQTSDEVPMSFDEIEQLTGQELPPSHRYRAWWSNNPLNSVMTKVWLGAGFESREVDMQQRRLVFRRVMPHSTVERNIEDSAGSRPQKRGRHPLMGALRGFMRVVPGADLTEPADPDWGKDA